jgi:DNA invertase Pin-like site-specific DNA recombinase
MPLPEIPKADFLATQGRFQAKSGQRQVNLSARSGGFAESKRDSVLASTQYEGLDAVSRERTNPRRASPRATSGAGSMANALIVKETFLPSSRKARHAAQYVRMSTDHQRYSTENQASAIAAYAAERNINVIRTYRDEGRSGLRIFGRDGLGELIDDVQLGRAQFDCILVYDVSRWGRFQDVDESAYYEFICRKAGIQVHYCAEQFENDGSLASNILKNLKRAMAGEYSRDLSTKVFIGQCRITELGFWHGGQPGYGLRRQLIDDQGTPRGQLEYGQQKFLQTDRVILKPGPTSEIETVRRIFRAFVTQRKRVTEIAADLNADQIPTSRGNHWSGQTIDKVLTCEAYIGNIVFNRTSFKLKQKAVINPPEMWIRRTNALDAIIAPKLFAKAQEIIARRRQRLTDQEVLDRLSALWRKKGHLSHKIIIATDDVPDTSTYIKRFGSLAAAYKLIGFQPKPRYRWAETRARIRSIVGLAVTKIASAIRELGVDTTFDEDSCLLNLNEKVKVSIVSARCISYGVGSAPRWRVRADWHPDSELTLVVRMDASNKKIQNYYLLPTKALPKTRCKKLCITNRFFPKSNRYNRSEALVRALLDV